MVSAPIVDLISSQEMDIAWLTWQAASSKNPMINVWHVRTDISSAMGNAKLPSKS